MAWLLAAVCIALLVVTALGIVGLASFWVQQRTRQIGMRRALGATRGQILRYFQTENFLLATLGIVARHGAGLRHQPVADGQVRAAAPAAGCTCRSARCVLWLLGQIAVLGPARRAAAVPPAVATRSSDRLRTRARAAPMRRGPPVRSHMPTVLVIDDNPAVGDGARRCCSRCTTSTRARAPIAGRRPGAARARADRPGRSRT